MRAVINRVEIWPGNVDALRVSGHGKWGRPQVARILVNDQIRPPLIGWDRNIVGHDIERLVGRRYGGSASRSRRERGIRAGADRNCGLSRGQCCPKDNRKYDNKMFHLEME